MCNTKPNQTKKTHLNVDDANIRRLAADEKRFVVGQQLARAHIIAFDLAVDRLERRLGFSGRRNVPNFYDALAARIDARVGGRDRHRAHDLAVLEIGDSIEASEILERW